MKFAKIQTVKKTSISTPTNPKIPQIKHERHLLEKRTPKPKEETNKEKSIEEEKNERDIKSKELAEERKTIEIKVIKKSEQYLCILGNEETNKNEIKLLESFSLSIVSRKKSETTFTATNDRGRKLLSTIKNTGIFFLTTPLLLPSEDKKTWFIYLENEEKILKKCQIPLELVRNSEISHNIVMSFLPLFWPWIPEFFRPKSGRDTYGDMLGETPLPAPWIIWSFKKKQFIMNAGSYEFAAKAQKNGFGSFKSKEKSKKHVILESKAPRAAISYLSLCPNPLAEKLSQIYNRWPFLPQEISQDTLEKIMSDKEEDKEKTEKAVEKEARKHPSIFWCSETESYSTENEQAARKIGMILDAESEPPTYRTKSIEKISPYFFAMDISAQAKLICALILRSTPSLPENIENQYPEPASLAFTYDTFQTQGIKHCLRGPTTMLSDDMGTGKTVQACGLADTLRTIKKRKNKKNTFKALFIIPPDIATKWAYHAIFVPENPFHVFRVDRTNYENIPENQKKYTTVIPPEEVSQLQPETQFDASITLLPISRIASCSELLEKEWDLIVTDEGHAISKSIAERTRIFFREDKNKKINIRSDYFVQMTGTDITNTISDYYYIVRMIIERGNKDIKTPYISEEDFVKIFNSKTKNENTEENNIEEIESKETKETRIAELAIALDSGPRIRRLKTEVYPDLPPKMPPKTWIIPARIDDKNIERQQEIMKKLGYHSLGQKEKISETMKKELEQSLEKSRIETARYKIPYVVKAVKKIASYNEPILLYAHHTEIADKLGLELQKAGVDVVIAHGKNTSPEARFEIGQNFNKGKHQVLCTTINAFYAGHDTTRTRLVFFIEMDHKSWMISQCQDRSWRRGQKRRVYVRFFVVPKSYDDIMAQSIIEKTRIHTIASGDDRRIFNASL